MNRFAEKLKERMDVLGISQGQLAKMVGVTQPAVQKWRTGEREPNFDMLLKICIALNTDPNELLGYDEIG